MLRFRSVGYLDTHAGSGKLNLPGPFDQRRHRTNPQILDRSRPIDPELGIAYVKNSLGLDSPEMKQIQDCAKENSIAVGLGFSERCNDSLYIAQVMIGADGEIKTHRRKMKPTHMERTVFGDASGECFSTVVQLPFARVGTLACWEHLQPLLKYHTISQQEDIHVGGWPNAPAFTGGPSLFSLSGEGESKILYMMAK